MGNSDSKRKPKDNSLPNKAFINLLKHEHLSYYNTVKKRKEDKGSSRN